MECNIPSEVMGQVEMSGLGMNDEFMDSMISSVAHSIPPVRKETQLDPIEYLKKYMDEHGLRNKDLKIYIGSSGNVCSVLKRRKPLTLRMIRNLHKYLHISAEILIQPYDCH